MVGIEKKLEAERRLLKTDKVGSLTPIAAVSFLWRATEQKDLAESGQPVSKLLYPFVSKKNPTV